jgi:hypothetical protein
VAIMAFQNDKASLDDFGGNGGTNAAVFRIAMKMNIGMLVEREGVCRSLILKSYSTNFRI